MTESIDGNPWRILELVAENEYHLEQDNNVDQLEQFSVIPGFQEELVEFAKKKLLDSIEVQQFLVERDIEFQEKNIASLIDELSDNQDDESNSKEIHLELKSSKNKYEGLRKKIASFKGRQQKAVGFLNSGLEEIRILTSPNDKFCYKVKNASWRCSVDNSIDLQKIKLICEKLIGLEKKMEVTFWTSEIMKLLENLDQRHYAVAFGIIIGMATWEYENSEKYHLLALIHLSIGRDETKTDVLLYWENWENESIEQSIVSLRILMIFYMKISIDDLECRENFEFRICQVIVFILEHKEFESSHLTMITELLGSIEQRFGNFTEMCDIMFTHFEAKAQMFDSYEAKMLVFMRNEHLSLLQTQHIDQCMDTLNILILLYLKIKIDKWTYREIIEQRISQFIICILEHTEFQSIHLTLIIQHLESIEQQFGCFSGKFDNMFKIFELKLQILDRPEQERVSKWIKSLSLRSSISEFSSEHSHSTVTVIEHSEKTYELEQNVRIDLEETLKLEKRIEEVSIEESKKKQEKLELKQREEEEARIKEEEEKQRKILEEEARKKQEEEEARLKAEEELKIYEEEKRKKELEEERKKKEELEIKRKAEEEKKKKLWKRKRKEKSQKRKLGKNRKKKEKSRRINAHSSKISHLSGTNIHLKHITSECSMEKWLDCISLLIGVRHLAISLRFLHNSIVK